MEYNYTDVDMLPLDAIKFMRSRRRNGKTSFYLSVGQQALVEGRPDKVFRVMANVHVSLKDAEKFILSAYPENIV